MKPKNLAIICLLGSVFMFYMAYQDFMTHKKIADHGQLAMGQLKEVTKKRFAFVIPTGQSMNISYQGTQKNFSVPKDVLAKYSDLESSKFRVDTTVPVLYLPEDPKTSLLADMKDTQAYWGGGLVWDMGLAIMLILTAIFYLNLAKKYTSP